MADDKTSPNPTTIAPEIAAMATSMATSPRASTCSGNGMDTDLTMDLEAGGVTEAGVMETENTSFTSNSISAPPPTTTQKVGVTQRTNGQTKECYKDKQWCLATQSHEKTQQQLATSSEDNHKNCTKGNPGKASRLRLLQRRATQCTCIPPSRRHQLSALLFSFMVFCVLSTIVIGVCLLFANAEEEDVRAEAQELAENTGAWFSDQLDQAMMPLFSIAQFATELELFRDLPNQIGPASSGGGGGRNQSLPFLPPQTPNGPMFTHRNVTGVCDDPILNARYNQIVATVLKHSKMQGVLEKLNLAPEGVVCLMQQQPQQKQESLPANHDDNGNTSTNPTVLTIFPPPQGEEVEVQTQLALDPKKGWGMDLLHDPISKFAARAALLQADQDSSAVVEGPRPIRQCMDCDPYFIARLAIPYEGHSMVMINDIGSSSNGNEDNAAMNQEVFPNRWGFATALINWKVLKERSNIQETFASRGFEFQLTRTDRVFNDTTQAYDVKVVVLAESLLHDGHDSPHGHSHEEQPKPHHHQDDHYVTTSLQTTNNKWELTVYYDHNSWGQWRYWLIPVCVAIAALVAVLVYIVLMQKHAHALLQGEQKAQDARVEMERNMTAYFAHELRNPLGAMDSALMAMPDDQELPSVAVELIAGMRLCASFMSSIMNNLLDVRKMEEGHLTLQNDPLSLEELVQGVHQMLSSSVNDKIAFTVDYQVNDKAPHYVLGDLHRIQQVLTNVTTNAIKYTREGSITLKVFWEDDKDTNAKDGDPPVVVFQCIDTGPGIPISEQARIFEKYVQRGGAPGTGLGLSIAKSIVALMNGSISFESDPTIKPGTTCTIKLPLQVCDDQDDDEQETNPSSSPDNPITTAPTSTDATSNSSQSGAVEAAYNAGNKILPAPSSPKPPRRSHQQQEQQLQEPVLEEPLSILIVDDIKMNRMMLKRRTQKGIAPNATIVEACTGEEALQICAGNAPIHDSNTATTDGAVDNTANPTSFDVIIVDQYMSEAGGVLLGTDTVIALRRMGVLDSLIIGCSGNDMAAEFMSAGADYVWQKPMPSNPEIIRQIRQGLQQKRSYPLKKNI